MPRGSSCTRSPHPAPRSFYNFGKRSLRVHSDAQFVSPLASRWQAHCQFCEEAITEGYTSSQKRAFVDLSHALDSGVKEVKLGNAEVDIVFGPHDVAPRRPPIVSRGRDPTCGRRFQLAAAGGVVGELQQRKHIVSALPCKRRAVLRGQAPRVPGCSSAGPPMAGLAPTAVDRGGRCRRQSHELAAILGRLPLFVEGPSRIHHIYLALWIILVNSLFVRKLCDMGT